MEQLSEYLKSINACSDAIKWAEGKDLKTAWETCQRGDWMIWLLTNSDNEVTDRELRLIAVKCAREVQHLMTDPRSINALDVAERFANGEATQEDLYAAMDAAWAAAWAARDAAWAAARDAARAARDAARDARDAAWAAAWAASDAARAAARAASDAARDAAWAARDAAWAKQAKIVRCIVPTIKIK